MGVSYKHPDYVKWLPIWKKCRDAEEGQEAIHGADTLYLSRLADETDQQYSDRKALAVFYDATHRTVEGMMGMLFRKPAIVTSKTNEDLFDNIDLAGLDVHDSLRFNTKEAMVVGRFGLLNDFPQVDGDMTQAELDAMGARPSTKLYKAETIINWDTTVINGREALSLVVLVEDVRKKIDEFQSEESLQYRVLDLEEGFYRQRVFIESDGGDVQVGEDIFPEMNSAKQTDIPFYFYPAVKPSRPPLLGLIDMNISHYRTTADYEHGLHLSMPMLAITGYTPKPGESVNVGSRKAQTFPDADTKVEYVEVKSKFEGQKESLAEKKKNLAVLGIRMLENQQRQTESAETAAIHRGGEVSTLAALSIALSNTYTKALTRMIEWAGGSNPEVVVALNKDFVPFPLSPQLVTSLLAAVQSGEMSSEAFFYNMKQGEFYPEAVDYETEQERISQTPPPAPDGVE